MGVRECVCMCLVSVCMYTGVCLGHNIIFLQVILDAGVCVCVCVLYVCVVCVCTYLPREVYHLLTDVTHQ